MEYIEYFQEVKVGTNTNDISNMNYLYIDINNHLSNQLETKPTKIKKAGSLATYTVSRTKVILDIDITLIYDDKIYHPNDIEDIKKDIQSTMSKYSKLVDGTLKSKRKVVECVCEFNGRQYSVDIVPVLKVSKDHLGNTHLVSVKILEDESNELTPYSEDALNNYNAATRNHPTPRIANIALKNVFKTEILCDNVNGMSLPSFYIRDNVGEVNSTKNNMILDTLCTEVLETIQEDAIKLRDKQFQGDEEKYYNSIYYSIVNNNYLDSFIGNISEFLEDR